MKVINAKNKKVRPNNLFNKPYLLIIEWYLKQNFCER